MYAVGYSGTKAFRTLFKRVTGVLPGAYRDKSRRQSRLSRRRNGPEKRAGGRAGPSARSYAVAMPGYLFDTRCNQVRAALRLSNTST